MLVVDKHVTIRPRDGFAPARTLFGAEREIRLRPSYFPFTEPSASDVSCFKCGKWMAVMSQTYYGIEILGLRYPSKCLEVYFGIDSTVYSAVVFGLGPDRVC